MRSNGGAAEIPVATARVVDRGLAGIGDRGIVTVVNILAKAAGMRRRSRDRQRDRSEVADHRQE